MAKACTHEGKKKVSMKLFVMQRKVSFSCKSERKHLIASGRKGSGGDRAVSTQCPPDKAQSPEEPLLLEGSRGTRQVPSSILRDLDFLQRGPNPSLPWSPMGISHTRCDWQEKPKVSDSKSKKEDLAKDAESCLSRKLSL